MPSLKSCSQVSWVKRHQVSAQFNFKNTALLVVVIQITPNQSSLQLLSSVEPHWIFPWLISRREKLSLQDLGWLCDTIDWCEYYWIYTQPSHFQIIHVDHQFQISSLNSGIPLAIVRAFIYCVNQPNNPRECPGPELSTTRVRLTDECESTCSSQGPCVPPSCISEPRFEQFFCPDGCLQQGDLAKIGHFYAFTRKSRESVPWACMFEVSNWQDTNTVEPRLGCIQWKITASQLQNNTFSALVSWAADIKNLCATVQGCIGHSWQFWLPNVIASWEQGCDGEAISDH